MSFEDDEQDEWEQDMWDEEDESSMEWFPYGTLEGED